ncbi:LamG domain-containing protein [Bacillus horti]|uniref:LamG-like jellyroll fold domain-containing protein n=1 Tax=Caldalkalibacillus horti TaxID=77523 RepID=A0ABT9VZ80_9BACI|nr:LamG domain-containing protein [Bacillus horti]MDQ0166127.1 hypothetical protein [Bacillus horti]
MAINNPRSLSMGTGAYFDIDVKDLAIDDPDLGDFTVECWMYVRGGEYFMSSGAQTTDTGMFMSYRTASGNLVGVRTRTAYYSLNPTGSLFKPNEWAHYALTWKQDTQEAKFYVDGEMVGILERTGNGANQSTRQYLRINSASNNNTATRGNAIYEDLRIWGRARTEQEIKSNMNVLVDPQSEGLQRLFRFDDLGKYTVCHVTGESFTFINDSPAWVNGEVDFRIEGDVPIEYDRPPFLKALNNPHALRVNNSTILINTFQNMFGENNYRGHATMMLWVKPLSLSTQDSFVFSDGNFNESFIALRSDRVWARWTHNTGAITHSTNLTIGKWYHLCLTHHRNGSNFTLKLYLDGVLCGETNVSSNDANYGGDGNLTLAHQLHAEIDDFRVWRRVLSQEEIIQNSRFLLSLEDEQDMVGHWKMDEGLGATLGNSYVDSHHGRTVGALWIEGELHMASKIEMKVKEPKDIAVLRNTNPSVCIDVKASRVSTDIQTYPLTASYWPYTGSLYRGNFDKSNWAEIIRVSLNKYSEDVIDQEVCVNSYAQVIEILESNRIVISDVFEGLYGKFAVGDKVMIHVSGGVDTEIVGRYEYFRITGIEGDFLALDGSVNQLINQSSLKDRIVQAVKVPEFVRLTVEAAGGKIVAEPYNGRRGGIVAIDVKREFNLKGMIDVSGRGYRDEDASLSPNNGEWAHRYNNAENGGAGGGNQFRGGDGAPDDGSRESYGGESVGTSQSLAEDKKMYFGGAGGKGGDSRSNTGFWWEAPGGNGGGIVHITARTLHLGTICANGFGGGQTSTRTTTGGAGGGAGGTIRLDCHGIVNLTNFCLGATGGGGSGGIYARDSRALGNDGTNQGAGQGGTVTNSARLTIGGNYFSRGGYPFQSNGGGGGGASTTTTQGQVGEGGSPIQAGKAFNSGHVGGGGGGAGGHIIIQSNTVPPAILYPQPVTAPTELVFEELGRILLYFDGYYQTYNQSQKSWEKLSTELPDINQFALRGMETLFNIPINSISEDFEILLWSPRQEEIYVEVVGIVAAPHKHSISEKYGMEYSYVSEFVKGDGEFCLTVPYDFFADTVPKHFTIRAESEYGDFVEEGGIVMTLVNTPPNVTINMNQYDLEVTIKDSEEDPFTYQIKLNGQVIVPSPTDGEWAETDTEVIFTRRFDSSFFNIGGENVIEVTATDSWGDSETKTYHFEGVYYGIMFADEAGSFYSTELGSVLKRLIIGPLKAGQISDIYRVRLINQQPFKVRDIGLSLGYDEEIPHTILKFSKSAEPFMPQDELFYDGVLDYMNEVDFFVQFFSTSEAKGKGRFSVVAMATPVREGEE